MTKHRLQFDFNEAALRELDELQSATSLPTRAELIRQALRLLQWMFTETQQNRATILIEKGGKTREVVFPFWTPTNAAPHDTKESQSHID